MKVLEKWRLDISWELWEVFSTIFISHSRTVHVSCERVEKVKLTEKLIFVDKKVVWSLEKFSKTMWSLKIHMQSCSGDYFKNGQVISCWVCKVRISVVKWYLVLRQKTTLSMRYKTNLAIGGSFHYKMVFPISKIVRVGLLWVIKSKNHFWRTKALRFIGKKTIY